MPSLGIASDHLENELYDHVLRNLSFTPPATVYVALFDVDPGDDGTGGTELSGGGYARQAVAFSAPTNGQGSNTGQIVFPTAVGDWGGVSGWALFDAVSAGNMLFHGALEISKFISDGQDAKFEAGDLEITFT